MSKLLNEIKKSVKEKALEEAFKSDDKVSEVPEVAFDKSAPATKLKQSAESRDESEKNKKIESKKGNAASDNKDDITKKKLKQVNEEGHDDEDDVDDEDKVKDGEEVELDKPEPEVDDSDDDDEDDVSDDEDEDELEVRKVTKEDLNIKEHIDALLGTEELTEEFKAKTQNIFETAVIAAANEVISETVQSLLEQKEAEQEQFVECMVDKMDDYLDKVVNEWLEENRVAVQQNVRTEIAESFLAGLKTLFEDHYIDIPDDKVDVVEELVSRVSALETTLDEEINKNIVLEKELTESKKEVLVMEHLDGLSANQKERLKMLAEGIDLEDEEDFVQQIEDLKESYFAEHVKKTSVDEDNQPVILNENEDAPKLHNPIGEAIAASITKNIRKNR